ncbi:CBS domain-containing protein [Pseudooceanicola sp.]|uniref:CBS domain-containing protein n=1 Tax=Pseudooceanicola sp. TaxID=1914328 RepID=UPI00261A5346|nr:CBS domain-containing protein [Pseudooceanicola sp.]MDF1855938.1 CBS domain-containing protein [Pseudooceanicola sp.]
MAEREVTTIMSREFLLLDEGCPMRDAIARLLAAAQPLACICGEAGELLGVLTPKDCFRSALNASYYQQWSDTVGNHMSRSVVTLQADIDIIAAAEVFQEKPYRAYPVTEGTALVGVLTRENLLRAFLELG